MSKRNARDECRINFFPDDVLVYIISFLPTKYAVGTSVLSTRWKYLWTSTSTLDFSDSLLFDNEKRSYHLMVKKKFMDFVDRVLHLHQSNNFNRFRISCNSTINYDATWFNNFFTSVIKCDIQELILTISVAPPSRFPECLLHFQSLTKLRLDTILLLVPASLCFPTLRVLDLIYIILFGEQTSQKLVLRFPVLEEFSLCHFSWESISVVHIHAPCLKRLTINDANFRCPFQQDFEINIYAESLTSLKFTNNLSSKYSLHKVSSLVDAFIDINTKEDRVDRMVNLLRGICNKVQDLQLSDSTIKCLFQHNGNAFTQSPKFLSLIHLRVIVQDDGFDVSLLIELIHKLPNVESLILEGPFTCDYVRDGSAVVFIPQCLLSCLKLFKLMYFSGSESELCFLEFLLKNAVVLKKMIVYTSDELSEDAIRKEKITKKLLMLQRPRGSACCLVDIF